MYDTSKHLEPRTCTGCGVMFSSFGALGNHGRYSRTCTQEMRFWGRVDKSAGPDACWTWRGAHDRYGYGLTNYGKRRIGTAHRYAWQLVKGKIADGLHVLHRCDNPGCVNPAHLRLGTHQENMAESVAKNRCWRGGNKQTKEQRQANARKANATRWAKWRAERASAPTAAKEGEGK